MQPTKLDSFLKLPADQDLDGAELDDCAVALLLYSAQLTYTYIVLSWLYTCWLSAGFFGLRATHSGFCPCKEVIRSAISILSPSYSIRLSDFFFLLIGRPLDGVSSICPTEVHKFSDASFARDHAWIAIGEKFKKTVKLISKHAGEWHQSSPEFRHSFRNLQANLRLVNNFSDREWLIMPTERTYKFVYELFP